MTTAKYASLLARYNLLLAEYQAHQIANQQRALKQSQAEVPAKLGDVNGKMLVPGDPTKVLITRPNPGCKPVVLKVPNRDVLISKSKPGAGVGMRFPPLPGPPPTVLPPHPPATIPPKPKPVVPPVLSPVPPYPRYPRTLPPGKRRGNKVLDVPCLAYDSGPGYGEVDLSEGSDITSSLYACAAVPCGYMLITAIIRIAYDSYAGFGVTPDIFAPGSQTSGSQVGWGDDNNYCYVVDTLNVKQYAAMNLVTTKSAFLIYNFWQGISNMVIDLTGLQERVRLFAKAHDVPFPFGGSHGRVAIWLLGYDYELGEVDDYIVELPLHFDFSTEAGCAHWTGQACGWVAERKRLEFVTAYYQYPVYIAGGTYTVTTVGYPWFGDPWGGIGFDCFYEGVSNWEVLSEEWDDSNGYTAQVNIPDGVYRIHMSGMYISCQSASIS